MAVQRYIWHKTRLSDLTWDSQILMNKLSKVSNMQGHLSGLMAGLGFEQRNVASWNVMTEDILRSSEIEGVILNPDRVRSSVARNLGIETEGLPEPDHYTEGVVQVMIDAIRNCQEPLTHERLFDWHAALFPSNHSGSYKITVAAYRVGEEPMQVVSGAWGKEKVHYEAPSSADVPFLMDEYLHWLKNTDGYNPVIKAAIAHLWFVVIHPFDDGNGRLTRTITDMFLSRADGMPHRFYSMSAEILKQRKGYYEALEKTTCGGSDITLWLEWFLNVMEQALSHSEEMICRVVEKAKFWEHFRAVAMNDRQVKIINRLWDGFEGKLNTSKWAKMTKSSQATALRDITDLLEKGVLRKSEEGGRSTNYELNI